MFKTESTQLSAQKTTTRTSKFYTPLRKITTLPTLKPNIQLRESKLKSIAVNQSLESALNQSKTTYITERRKRIANNSIKTFASPDFSRDEKAPSPVHLSKQEIQNVNFHQILIEQQIPENITLQGAIIKLSKLEDDKQRLCKLKILMNQTPKLLVYDTLQTMLNNEYTYASPAERKYHIQLSNLLASVTFDFGDYQKALFYNKQIQSLCNYYKDFKGKIKAYYRVARCYMFINQYDKALIYVKKMLKLAWLQSNQDHEISAYDMLGKLFYFKGMLQHSKFFHDRCVNGVCEPKESPIRILGEQVLRLHQQNPDYYSDSEDEFDLEMFTNQIQKSNYNPMALRNVLKGSSIGIVRKIFADVSTRSDTQITDLRSLPMGFGVCKMKDQYKTTYLISEKQNVQPPMRIGQKSQNRHLENFFVNRHMNRKFWSSDNDEMIVDNIKHYQIRKKFNQYIKLITGIEEQLQTVIVEVYFNEFKQ